MPTTQQMLNACDDVMKTKIKELLFNFWKLNAFGTGDLLNDSIKKYTEIFFKIINMDKKYCIPQEPKSQDIDITEIKVLGYSWSEIIQIINYSKQMNFKPKKDGE